MRCLHIWSTKYDRFLIFQLVSDGVVQTWKCYNVSGVVLTMTIIEEDSDEHSEMPEVRPRSQSGS